MTTYTAILSTETDPDKPLKSDLAKRWSDNPLAIAEGDTSVPVGLFPSVLLGVLTTTSGTVQTLSGLVLTKYRFLFIDIIGVSFNAASIKILLDGKPLCSAMAAAADVGQGHAFLNLANGSYSSNTHTGSQAALDAGIASTTHIGNTAYSTASTSISFSGGTFDAGSIRIYGLK